MYQESFKGVLSKIGVKGVFSGFQGYLQNLQSKFQGKFKCVSRKFQGCSNKDFRVLQGSFKDVARKFQGRLRVFQ